MDWSSSHAQYLGWPVSRAPIAQKHNPGGRTFGLDLVGHLYRHGHYRHDLSSRAGCKDRCPFNCPRCIGASAAVCWNSSSSCESFGPSKHLLLRTLCPAPAMMLGLLQAPAIYTLKDLPDDLSRLSNLQALDFRKVQNQCPAFREAR